MIQNVYNYDHQPLNSMIPLVKLGPDKDPPPVLGARNEASVGEGCGEGEGEAAGEEPGILAGMLALPPLPRPEPPIGIEGFLAGLPLRD